MKRILSSLAAVLLLLPMPVTAEQDQASVNGLAWMTGSWKGPGIGGAPAVEVYSAPAGGQMIGHFRQLKPDGSIMFYELISIAVRDGKLRYRVKHFNPDLTGWEEKGDATEFTLIKAEANRWEFSGLVIERQSPKRMTMAVTIRGDTKTPETLVFRYRKD